MTSVISFKPKMVPTAAAVGAMLITAALGDWQLNRAAYKAELQTRLARQRNEPPVTIGRELIDPATLTYHPVQVRGVFDAAHTALVDNRVHQGVVGYWVVSPLKIAGSERYVLIERGWIAGGADRRHLPAVTTPTQEVEIKGIALPGNPPVFELSHQVVAGNVWQNVTVDRFSQHFGLSLQPLIVQQQNDVADGLVRDWALPTLGIERHRAYAFQWFSLAAVILVLYIALNVRRKHLTA